MNTKYLIPLGIMLIIQGIIRFAWLDAHPSVWAALAFFLASISLGALKALAFPFARVLVAILLVGGALNALVMLSNSGHMVGDDISAAHGLWIPATSETRLNWLGDNHAGYSIGDFFLLGGNVIWSIAVFIGLLRMMKRRNTDDRPANSGGVGSVTSVAPPGKASL
jgi:apolipoprotein N-acyltransferase